jgi:hypothetical protein
MNASKLIRAVSTAFAVLAFASGASAQVVLSSANVNVKVNLTSQCKLAAAAPTLAVDFGSYTAFQAGAAAPATPQTFDVKCTHNFGTAPTVTWDTGSGLGVISGLQYTLSLSGGTPAKGADATATTGAGADTITFTLDGSMPGLQAGDNAGAGAQTASRTVTLKF